MDSPVSADSSRVRRVAEISRASATTGAPRRKTASPILGDARQNARASPAGTVCQGCGRDSGVWPPLGMRWIWVPIAVSAGGVGSCDPSSFRIAPKILLRRPGRGGLGGGCAGLPAGGCRMTISRRPTTSATSLAGSKRTSRLPVIELASMLRMPLAGSVASSSVLSARLPRSPITCTCARPGTPLYRKKTRWPEPA